MDIWGGWLSEEREFDGRAVQIVRREKEGKGKIAKAAERVITKARKEESPKANQTDARLISRFRSFGFS
jgi:hypothetical protein